MPETATTIHLSTLFRLLWDHKAKKEIEFWKEVERRAALLAKEDSHRGPVKVDGYSRLVYPDDPDPYDLMVPPAVLEKAKSEIAAREAILDAVKDGKLDLIEWSSSGIDLSLLDQQECVAIKFKLPLALTEISQEQLKRYGSDGRTCIVWQDFVQEIIKHIKAPLDAAQLGDYAERVCLDDLPQSNVLTIAIADLHDTGFTEQWLKRIWQKYANEAGEAELPCPTDAGSNSDPVRVLCTQGEIDAAVWRYLASVNYRSGLSSQDIATALGVPKRDSMVRKSPAWKQYLQDQKKPRRVPSDAMEGLADQTSDSQSALDKLVAQEDWKGAEKAQQKEERRQHCHDVPQPRQRRKK